MSYIDDPAYWSLQQIRGRHGCDAIADAWASWSGSRPLTVTTEPVWTSYRPFRKARVVLRTTVISGDGANHEMDILFAAHGTDSAFLSELAATPAIDSPPDVLAPFAVDSWRASAWVLPHVPRPAALAAVMRPQALESMLPWTGTARVGDVQLLRYVPMRRALLRFSDNGRLYFAKTFDKAKQYRQSAEAFEFVADLPVRIPRLIARAPGLRTLIMDSLSGRQLTDYLLRGSLQPLLDTGAALASVHGHGSVPARIRTSQAELDAVKQLLQADLALACPSLAERVEGLAEALSERLQELGEADPVTVHGSLFGDQILFDAKEKCPIAIVDWDALAGGDPHFDLGRLIAHALFLSIRTTDGAVDDRIDALIQGYRDAGGALDAERLCWHVATALLLRAKISLLRTLDSQWESSMSKVLDQAATLLAGRSYPVGRKIREIA